jgi:hypothetical protein
MQVVVKSGPESQPTAPGNRPIAVDNRLIAAGSKQIAPRGPLVDSEYLGRERK